ncbi:MAG: zinc metallopeptidase [Gammaproteobacteria bacterium]|nr:zinc metallopeptidase [Gammaproteobacteria bacterium]
MRWKKGRRSTNVEDRRGRPMRAGASIGGGAIIMALIAVFVLGQDPAEVIQQVGGGVQQSSGPAPQRSAAEEQAADFVSVVLADTEDTWGQIFRQAGGQYKVPTLVLYTDQVQSACGFGSAAAGPFYCPGDDKLYLDLSFLGELQRMGAAGDFAVAYVIAHEVGHHIQNLTGVARQVQSTKQRLSKADANALQVKMELQADCFSGVWAHHANRQRQILEPGDVEEGLRAAAAVGDDHLQRQAGRRVTPEAFTHGTSQQRMSWFRRGLDSGDANACDTFGS